MRLVANPCPHPRGCCRSDLTCGGKPAQHSPHRRGQDLLEPVPQPRHRTCQLPTDPPVGGNHAAVPLTCGIYNQPVPNENAVHSLEHGALWITYRPALPAAQLGTLKGLVQGNDHRLLSPYPELPQPIVATAWGVQLEVSSADDPQLAQFVRTYTQGVTTPESGAAWVGVGTPTGLIALATFRLCNPSSSPTGVLVHPDDRSVIGCQPAARQR